MFFYVSDHQTKCHRLVSSVTWVSHVLCMICILVAQKHYTIDVVIGYFVTSRFYVKFHTALNKNTLKRFITLQRFLEPPTNATVLNEFDIPKIGLQRMFIKFILCTKIFKRNIIHSKSFTLIYKKEFSLNRASYV